MGGEEDMDGVAKGPPNLLLIYNAAERNSLTKLGTGTDDGEDHSLTEFVHYVGNDLFERGHWSSSGGPCCE